jgi:ferric-dicitrate binding protein FerR (iron transport regulator)
MDIDALQMKILLQKVLQQTATTEEKETFAAYIRKQGENMDPEWWLPYEEWQLTANGMLPEGMEQRLMSHILEGAASSREAVIIPVRTGKEKKYLRYAAAIVLLLATSSAVFFGKKTAKVTMVSFIAKPGDKQHIKLPDGSVVYLNAGSSMQYRMPFEGNARYITLSGEAFFEVTQNEHQPFVVRSGDMETTVLGTSFNIKAYPGEPGISIAVKTGKVSVATKASGHDSPPYIYLTSGQQAIYGRDTRLFTLARMDTAAISGWKENRLVFEDASLEEICHTLGRQYNVKFITANQQLPRDTYSVTFNQLTLQESLEKLTLLGDLQFLQKDSIITIQ